MYSVEVALDLNELESLTNERRNVRDMLEKCIAVWKATGMIKFLFLLFLLFHINNVISNFILHNFFFYSISCRILINSIH